MGHLTLNRTTQGIQNLSEFYMFSTLQQSLEDFLLELKFIKFRIPTEMGKRGKQHTFERMTYIAGHNKAQ